MEEHYRRHLCSKPYPEVIALKVKMQLKMTLGLTPLGSCLSLKAHLFLAILIL